jgi:hypothetical protein
MRRAFDPISATSALEWLDLAVMASASIKTLRREFPAGIKHDGAC